MKRKKPTHSLKFMAFLLISSVGMLISGLLISNLANLNTSFDYQPKASESTPPTISISHSPTTPIAGSPLTVNFQINTGSYQTTGIQMKNLSINDATESTLPSTLTNIAPLQTVQNNISSNTINYLSILQDFNTPYSTGGQTTTFATLTTTPQDPGDIAFNFDPSQTIVVEHNGAGTNILSTPTNHTITVGQAPQCTTNEDVCDPDSCDFDQIACDTQNDDGQDDNTNDDSSDDDSNTDDTAIGGPTCSVPYAPAKIVAKSGINPGEIIVRWVRPGDHKYFGISFGRKSGEYQWGDTNVGNTRDFTIRYLDPGQRYYIVITAVNDCGAGAYSQEVSAIARATTTTQAIAQNTPEPEVISNLPDPTPTPIPTATPSTTPIADEIEDTPSLIERILGSKLLYLTLGVIVALFIQSALTRHHPPLPPRHKLTPKPKGKPSNIPVVEKRDAPPHKSSPQPKPKSE